MSASNALSPGDPSSFSRPDQCAITDISLDVKIDFGRKVVHGTATYKCKKVLAGADSLILDTDQLTIFKVYCKQTSQDLQFSVGEPVGKFGSKLQITLLTSFPDDGEFEICVDYENSPAATGLQWMPANLTAGKRQPYLYSQLQSIFARTVLPCQDTPSVKHTYSARVTVDKALTVLMSAVPSPTEPAPNDQVTYIFQQPVPIPCYLIAIAVGDLTSKRVGPRTTVWTEPEMIDAAAWEFEKTEEMLKTAEDLCGQYIWGIYDILVLPPTFPYGGMENPCLTFATPTLIVGDRSLTNVIAHEIAHSWTGNLVTNFNWEHFWLNEGHTVFVERKIIGRLHGEDDRQFAMNSGWTELSHTIKEFGPTNPLTKLVLDLTDGTHPEDSFSTVPYEKGSAFLYTIETALGGAAVVEPWLRAYIQKFKGKSIKTDEWKEFLYSYFSTEEQQTALNGIDWEGWLNTPGMPANKPDYDMTLFEACETLCNRWWGGTDIPTTIAEFEAFTVNQKIAFLAELLLKDAMPVERILQMGDLYELPKSNNAEIVSRWYQLCLRGRTRNQLDPTLQFVTDVGRMKFVRPLYQDMYAFEDVRQIAIDTFETNRPNMHPQTAAMVAKDLHLE